MFDPSLPPTLLAVPAQAAAVTIKERGEREKEKEKEKARDTNEQAHGRVEKERVSPGTRVICFVPFRIKPRRAAMPCHAPV